MPNLILTLMLMIALVNGAFSGSSKKHPWEITSDEINVLIEQKRLQEAEVKALKALDLAKNSFGESDPVVVVSLQNLGYVHYVGGNFLKAIPFYEKAAKMARDNENVNGFLFVKSHLLLGDAYGKARRFADAADIVGKVLPSQIELEGATSPSVGKSFEQFGNFLMSAKRYGDAEKAFAKNLAIVRHNVPADHFAVAGALNSYGFALMMNKHDQEAEQMFKAAIIIAKKNESRPGELSNPIQENLNSLYRDRFPEQ